MKKPGGTHQCKMELQSTFCCSPMDMAVKTLKECAVSISPHVQHPSRQTFRN
ncbi:hypothetical protein Nmel_014798 [Mimus melanotis]